MHFEVLHSDLLHSDLCTLKTSLAADKQPIKLKIKYNSIQFESLLAENVKDFCSEINEDDYRGSASSSDREPSLEHHQNIRHRTKIEPTERSQAFTTNITTNLAGRILLGNIHQHQGNLDRTTGTRSSQTQWRLRYFLVENKELSAFEQI